MTVQVAGCLFQTWKEWQNFGAETWVAQVSREGYCIPFVGQLTLSVPISLHELFTQVRERKSFGGGSPDSSQEGFYSRVFVVPKVTGGASSSDRLVISQQFHPQDKILDGDQRFGSVGYSKERLDDVSGSTGYLLSHPNLPRKQKVPSFWLERSVFPVQGSLLQVVDCTVGLHRGHGSSFIDSALKGNPSPSLLGRLATAGNIGEGGFEVEGSAPAVMQEVSYNDQLEEVRVSSQSSCSVFLDGD